MTKNNKFKIDKGVWDGPPQTSSEHQFTLERGWVYWFDPLKKTEVNVSPLVVILSNTLHNRYSDNIIVALISSKNVERVEPTEKVLEVYCEVENKKLKVLVGEIHTIQKSSFFRRSIYLGKMTKEHRDEINEKLKFILQLDN